MQDLRFMFEMRSKWEFGTILRIKMRIKFVSTKPFFLIVITIYNTKHFFMMYEMYYVSILIWDPFSIKHFHKS
jgi:hypothetical protein